MEAYTLSMMVEDNTPTEVVKHALLQLSVLIAAWELDTTEDSLVRYYEGLSVTVFPPRVPPSRSEALYDGAPMVGIVRCDGYTEEWYLVEGVVRSSEELIIK